MLAASYIGDEHTGTGFALAGIATPPVPDSAEGLWQLILQERQHRQLVILSAACAPLVHERLMQLLETSPVPPVVVLPDAGKEGTRRDVLGEALNALGIGRIPG